MELSELGNQPISEDQPTGSDVRYESDFESLQQEIDKLSVASSESGGIDWEKVVALGQTILGEKSKNLLVAAYMGAGLNETRGLEGFKASLDIFKGLADNFWETMFPVKKRKRARINALEWWLERTEDYLSRWEGDPITSSLSEAVQDSFNGLVDSLDQKTEDLPNILRLKELLARIPVQPKAQPESETSSEEASSQALVDSSGQSESQAEPTDTPVQTESGKPEKSVSEQKPSPPPASTAKPSPADQASKPGSGDFESEKDAHRQLDSELKNLLKLSSFFRYNNPASILPYRLTRIAAWLNVDSLPPAESGRTKIPPPEGTIRSAIDNLWHKGDYLGVIQATEGRQAQFLFWLDLSRYTAQSLEQLGDSYSAAYEAVCQETSVFVQRLAGIEKICFADGTPFADQETRAWLKTIVLAKGESSSTVPSQSTESAGSEIASTMDQAMQMFQEKKALEGVQLIQDKMQAACSGRNRLLWRICLAQLLANIGKPQTAQPHLEEILAQIDQHCLEQWDPEVALSGLLTVYNGFNDRQEEELQNTAVGVLHRIARISPTEALKLSS